MSNATGSSTTQMLRARGPSVELLPFPLLPVPSLDASSRCTSEPRLRSGTGHTGWRGGTDTSLPLPHTLPLLLTRTPWCYIWAWLARLRFTTTDAASEARAAQELDAYQQQ